MTGVHARVLVRVFEFTLYMIDMILIVAFLFRHNILVYIYYTVGVAKMRAA